MKQMTRLMGCVMVMAMLGACASGERLGGNLVEELTPDGIWRIGRHAHSSSPPAPRR